MTKRRAATTKAGATPEVELRGMAVDAALRRRALTAVTAAVARVGVQPVRAHVTFFDDNGPKGGRAARCALTVRLPYRPHVRVEKVAETPRLAFDAALAVLERDLEVYRERARDAQRHPKKYFVAKRLREP
jgi:ribosome-associated translation inhibitor RaiA